MKSQINFAVIDIRVKKSILKNISLFRFVTRIRLTYNASHHTANGLY